MNTYEGYFLNSFIGLYYGNFKKYFSTLWCYSKPDKKYKIITLNSLGIFTLDVFVCLFFYKVWKFFSLIILKVFKAYWLIVYCCISFCYLYILLKSFQFFEGVFATSSKFYSPYIFAASNTLIFQTLNLNY